ncbi:replication factor C subunit 1 isoform X1 [Neodiprion fabricii]|uniref:replication factor C subunit 1 isoform X1 n=1 Tax=Neodiprion fabricii TaxID=2872261 RepID=UPI001ED9393E|nr:replication factor C subunit 1 isoform X1 [Neodiprion fabricii]
MSKAITSYFQVISSKKGTDSSSVSNNNKKKRHQVSDEDREKSVSPAKRYKPTKRTSKHHVLSDSESEVTEVKEKPRKGKSSDREKFRGEKGASGSKTSRRSPKPVKRNKKRHVLSDSEDEVVEVKEISKKAEYGKKEKLPLKKIATAADVFGNKPVKRIEAPKPSKKLMEEDDDFFFDDKLEAVLDQLATAETELDREAETSSKKNEIDNRKKQSNGNASITTGSSKEGRKTSKVTRSSEKTMDDTVTGINEDGQVPKKTMRNLVKQELDDDHKEKGSDKSPEFETSKFIEVPHSNKKTTKDATYQKGISKIEIDKTTGQKRKRSIEDDDPDPYEALIQKKKHNSALYQQYLQRGGARHPGSKEIPTGANNCLAGLSFLITGVLDSLERDEVDDLIKKYGGRLLHQVSKKTDYVILGDEPGPAKLEKTKKLGVKTISEDELLELIRTRPAGQGTSLTDDKHHAGKEKKLPSKMKRKTPEPETLTSSKLLSSETGNSSKLNSEISDIDPKSLISGYSGTTKSSEVLQSSNVPTMVRVPCETDSQVWVEKYKPKNMKQIIGQQGDKSNAHKLYNWLKNWQKNHSGDVKLTRPSPWAQHDGSFFKAALLSGPPGVGKTTTVQIVCNALNLDAIEFNASDTRSKRLLKEEVSELLNNKSMKSYFADGNNKKPDLDHVLVMDEVDGMAGNEDRGGLQELIALIKTTSVPVICICNDRNHPKMRTLSNYTFDLKFQKPGMNQIRSAMLSICFKEKIEISKDDLSRLIESTNCDVRQVLNHLSLLANNSSIDEVSKTRKCNKDLRLGPWDVVQKVFTFEAHKTMSIHDKSNLFFHDYNIAPLFVQENYLGVTPNCPKDQLLETVANAAESLVLGDLVENSIRRNGTWTLLPMQACYSSVIPGTLMAGNISRQIMFPSWLGQNSKRGKFDRLLQEITMHTRLATSSSKDAINLDYLKHLRDAVVKPLVDNGAEGTATALNVMNYYHLLREDLDSLTEVSLWPGQHDPMQALESKVKAAFTRAFNKSAIMRPYAFTKGTEKKKRAQSVYSEDALELEEEEEASEEDEDTPAVNVKTKTKKAPAAADKKAAGTSGVKKKSSNPRAAKSKANK